MILRRPWRFAIHRNTSQASPEEAVQIPVQQATETGGKAEQQSTASCRNSKENGTLQQRATCQGGENRIRTSKKSSDKSRECQASGADSGALRYNHENSRTFDAAIDPQLAAKVDPQLATTRDPELSEIFDPELAAIIAAWPTLSPAIRAGVIALVRAAEGRHE